MSNTGRYSYEKLSRILHEKARLGIMTCLFANKKGLSFRDLKNQCALSDGNLSRHMQALEEAGLVEVHKTFSGKRPLTEYKVTKEGEKEFLEYLTELERVIGDAYNVLEAKKHNDDLSINPL